MEVVYDVNGVFYKIVGSIQLHTKLQADPNFYQEYIDSNRGSFEIIGVDEGVGEEENQDPNTNLDIQAEDDNFTWTRKTILLFLEIIRRNKSLFRDPKIKKKTLWRDIAKELSENGYNVAETQIERKFRNMKQTYKNIRENKDKRKTGRGQVTWEYYDTMENIFCEDRTINFGHSISSMSHPKMADVLSLLCPSNPGSTATVVTSPTSIISSIPLVSPSSQEIPSMPGPSIHVKQNNSNKECTIPTETPKRIRTSKGRQLNLQRNRQLDIEEQKCEEIRKMRKLMEHGLEIYKEIRDIQTERNYLLKEVLKCKK